jgi:putative phosphoribosyl transferase
MGSPFADPRSASIATCRMLPANAPGVRSLPAAADPPGFGEAALAFRAYRVGERLGASDDGRMIFNDRHDAGRRLAAALHPFAEQSPVVVAVPRGGVPVGVEVALGLEAPLDLVTVRKLGAPQNRELAIGAIAEDGTAVFDDALIKHLNVSQGQVDEIRERETGELQRRLRRFRAVRPALDLHGHTVIVVDDGLATGLTDLAAVRAARARGAARVLVAVPVGSHQAVAMLERDADEVICLNVPDELHGVGAWYTDFSPVSDEEVISELARTDAPVPHVLGRSGEIQIQIGDVTLPGDLVVPRNAIGLVVFAHGSGSSRLSGRNRHVAHTLNGRGLATLLFDLLTEDESRMRELVFDIPLLTGRLEATARWVADLPDVSGLPVGLFGASTGAAAALRAAAELGDAVGAVVSRGGRPDLATDRLPQVAAPTLLIVGSHDFEVLELNRQAAAHLRCPHRLVQVEGATHLFEEPGALDAVAEAAGDWFVAHLGGQPGG